MAPGSRPGRMRAQRAPHLQTTDALSAHPPPRVLLPVAELRRCVCAGGAHATWLAAFHVEPTMAADAIQGFGSIVFAQIRYLVVNLNKKNQKSSMSEIAHLLGMYGEGAFIYLIQCLVEEIDFRDAKLQKDQLKVQLLAQEFGKLAGKPNFTQAVTQIFGSATLATPLTEEFLVALVKAIKAPMNQAHRRCRAVLPPATPPPCTARAPTGSLATGIRAPTAAFAAPRLSFSYRRRSHWVSAWRRGPIRSLARRVGSSCAPSSAS